MKGKYANAAEKRRAQEDLERRAAEAERERDRLAAEMVTTKSATDEQAVRLRAEIKGLREQRDAAAAPRIAELEAANNRLRVQRDYAIADQREMENEWSRTRATLIDALVDRFGLSGPEAKELVHTLANAPEIDFRPVSPLGVTTRDPSSAEGIQRLRGLRSSGTSPATAIAPDKRPVVMAGTKRDRARDAAAMIAAAQEKVLSSITYSYDSEETSVTFDEWGDGSIRISVECAHPDMLAAGACVASIILPADESIALARALGGDVSG